MLFECPLDPLVDPRSLNRSPVGCMILALTRLPQLVGTRIGKFGFDQRKRGMSRFGSCYYTTGCS